MSKTIKPLLYSILLLGLVLGLVVITQNVARSEGLTEGVDYQLIPQQFREAAPDKIEVVEYFSYKCQHCAHLEPKIASWLAHLPKDVTFRRVPVEFRPDWAPTVRLYYTLEALGEVNKLQIKVFEEIHEKNKPLATDEAVIAWAVAQGINQAVFEKTYRSFSIASRVSGGKIAAQKSAISFVPAIIIEGKYRVPGDKFAGNQDGILRAMEGVINEIRASRKTVNRK